MIEATTIATSAPAGLCMGDIITIAGVYDRPRWWQLTRWWHWWQWQIRWRKSWWQLVRVRYPTEPPLRQFVVTSTGVDSQ